MSAEETVVAEFPDVRHRKQDGTLILTSARVAWSSGEHFQVNHSFDQIKAQRISAESSSKVQLQLVLHAGSSANFHFTGPQALEHRNNAKQLLQRLLSKPTASSNPELEAKTTLLNSDPSLYQLYKDLVVGGLISAEEFWANRLSKQREESELNSKQESGLPSAFLADVQAVSDGCNAVKYNITTDVIQAIFRTYPSVKAKHAELVPGEMTEEKFWVQFFQSQLFHRDASSSSQGIFTDFLKKEHKSMLEGTPSSHGVLNATETASSESLGEGYSLVGEVPSSLATPLPLLTRCNLHSTRVLRALGEDGSAEPQQVMDDSAPLPDPQLTLRPSRLSQAPVAPSNTLATIARELASWSPQQEVNTVAAHSAIAHLIPGGSLMPSGGFSDSQGASLTHAQREQLFRHQAAIAELLRHFWACFPVLSPQLEEKVNQMAQCLRDYQDQKLPELSLVLGEGEGGRSAVDHLKSCITTALDKHSAWDTMRRRRS